MMKTLVLLAGVALLTSLSVAAADETTIQGCLSGPDEEGLFVLTTKEGEIEVGGLNNLKDHAGHEVKLTGTFVESGTEIGEEEEVEDDEEEEEQGQEDEEEEEEEHGEEAERHFKVTKVEHLAASCQ